MKTRLPLTITLLALSFDPPHAAPDVPAFSLRVPGGAISRRQALKPFAHGAGNAAYPAAAR